MSLDKLRAIDVAASPGPWEARGEMVFGPGNVEGYATKPMLGTGLPADAQLTALSHHLLPAMEALEKCAEKIEHTASSHAGEQWAEAAQARAVLAKLAEALR